MGLQRFSVTDGVPVCHLARRCLATTARVEFGSRNGAAANDLINVNFGSGNGQPAPPRRSTNIYVDPAGFNPGKSGSGSEPSWAFLALAPWVCFSRNGNAPDLLTNSALWFGSEWRQ
jgi:hypothetical protein